MSNVSQIKDYYEAYWTAGKDTYSGSNQGYASNFRRWMATQLSDLPKSAPILEVGCGDGSFTKDLTKYSSAGDGDRHLCGANRAKNARRYPEIAFRQHDVSERLPYPDGAFEVVWCSGSPGAPAQLPRSLCARCFCVLRPEGRLRLPFHITAFFKNLLIVLVQVGRALRSHQPPYLLLPLARAASRTWCPQPDLTP